jgi:peptidyl-prolyl cis-trans isomerase D
MIIYLINILSIVENNISKNSNNYEKYKKQTNMNIRNEMYGSYDFFLNEKYKIKINQKTLDRVKNYFR